MHLFTFATIAVLVSTAFTLDSTITTSIVTGPTGSCYTLTTTNPPTCTSTASTCTIEECITLSTITQSCGCASIYTSDVCVTTCPRLGCQASYVTVHDPCPTSPNSPTSPTSSTSPTSPTSSSYPSSPSSPTTPPYNNSTLTTTATTITTLTTCPATCTCSGQKTTWSGGQGPYSCTKSPSCVAQLPGGGATTITGTTVVSRTGPTPTTSVGPTAVTGSSDGKKRSEVL
ncbi:hypothetical protein N431DRAFT_561736 [Stipitochalara longipes BDJ]|nr:hypothetical protein N431DRAFT_561736 [Stipitochalara longipes BDJ]